MSPDRRQSVPSWLDKTAQYSWRFLIIGLVAFLLIEVMAHLALVTLPVILALILATLCVPAASALEERGVAPALSALIVVIGGLIGIVGLIALLVPSFVDQILALQPTVEAGTEAVLDWLETGPLNYDRERIDELLGQATTTASESSSQIFSGVVAGAGFVANLLAAFALMVVLLFFFVKDRTEIVGWFLARSPARSRETVAAVGRRAWGALSGYVRGTATIALIDAIGIGIGLLIIGVPLVLPLALLVFLGAFIPVIGALLAGLVAVLVGLADGGITSALLVLGLILLVQQVEGNVLQPIIMRRSVALHPTVVLVALAVGAALAGIVGAFLSVPVAAVLAAVGNELRVRNEAHHADDDEVAVPS